MGNNKTYCFGFWWGLNESVPKSGVWPVEKCTTKADCHSHYQFYHCHCLGTVSLPLASVSQIVKSEWEKKKKNFDLSCRSGLLILGSQRSSTTAVGLFEKGGLDSQTDSFLRCYPIIKLGQTPGDSEGQGDLACSVHGIEKSRRWLSDQTATAIA